MVGPDGVAEVILVEAAEVLEMLDKVEREVVVLARVVLEAERVEEELTEAMNICRALGPPQA
jgi:hypothetical protein